MPFDGRIHVTQTVADGESTTVYDHAAFKPTATFRFAGAVDFARICSGETTPLELVAAGRVEVEGDITMFAQVDLLKW